MRALQVEFFFDEPTFSYTYLIWDLASRRAAVIDSVQSYDPASGQFCLKGADRVVEFATQQDLHVDYILETHVHADHLTADHYLRGKLGGKIGIGKHVTDVQEIFGQVFNSEADFVTDGSQFDLLLADGDELTLGEHTIHVMHTPGHTPACVTYVANGCAFVGDTLFMPDYGTARTDFPGGNAETLYDSIQRILGLPDDTTLYMCHDYKSDTREEFACATSVAEERNNIHLKALRSREEFACFRKTRDKDLAAPRLLYPAVQYNMRGGAMPPAEENGRSYFKIPLRPAM